MAEGEEEEDGGEGSGPEYKEEAGKEGEEEVEEKLSAFVEELWLEMLLIILLPHHVILLPVWPLAKFVGRLCNYGAFLLPREEINFESGKEKKEEERK